MASDVEGCYAVVGAMWQQLRREVKGHIVFNHSKGDRPGAKARMIRNAIEYLHTQEFDAWCALSNAKPEDVRASLIADIPQPLRCYLRGDV